MTFSRTESLKLNKNCANTKAVPYPLYIGMDVDKAHHSDTSSFEESASPVYTDYKIKYADNVYASNQINGMHSNGNDNDNDTDSTGQSKGNTRRQMFISLVQYLIWRRSSNDATAARPVSDAAVATATATNTNAITAISNCDNNSNRPHIIALSSEISDQGFDDHVYDDIGSSFDQKSSGNEESIMEATEPVATDELSAYMEEIRLRELRWEYELGSRRKAH